MYKKNKAGFTLIELLVVIAIIGVLAPVVLASIKSARDKGVDAAIKSNLANALAEAEIFYDIPRSYDGVCAVAGANSIGDNVNAAKLAYGGTVDTLADAIAATWNTSQCHDSVSAWAAVAPLRTSVSGTPVLWCVDSAGTSKQVSGLAANDVICP